MRRGVGWMVVGVIACGVLAGCGDDDTTADTAGAARTTTTAAGAPSTTAAGGTGTTAAAGGADVWRQTAAEHRGQNGKRFTIVCTPNGKPADVWGAETYTDDSSICTAAVHVGLLTLEEGGEVEYEIAPGEAEYASGVAHGITSNRYAAYDGSFVFPEARPGSGTFTVGPESWRRTATEYRGKNGEQIAVDCGRGGPVGSIWGTGTYTDDSSICTAAVHAGLITVAEGGKVTIEVAPGEDSYKGSTANGVTSADYAKYEGSFTFPDA